MYVLCATVSNMKDVTFVGYLPYENSSHIKTPTAQMSLICVYSFCDKTSDGMFTYGLH